MSAPVPSASGAAPRRLVVAGAILSGLGVVLAMVLFQPDDLSPARFCCLLFGPCMWLSGRYDAARRRRIGAEAERARNEWPELRRELTLAARMQLDAQRLLADRGYAEPSVRRWIVWELRARGTE